MPSNICLSMVSVTSANKIQGSCFVVSVVSTIYCFIVPLQAIKINRWIFCHKYLYLGYYATMNRLSININEIELINFKNDQHQLIER